MNHTTRSAAIAVAIAGLAVPTAAQAHVTVQPDRATAGSYTVESIRVPNETDDATTTKVAVQFPDGFASVSYQAIPGWTARIKTSKLATPIKTDDGDVTEQVDQVTFAAAPGKGIAPGQFQDFPLSVKLPDKPGTLTFKALQTYDDGDVVRWIGAPDADEPAPQLTTSADSAAAADDTGSGDSTPTADASVTAASATPAAASTDDGTDSLTIVALVLGASGLLAGIGGLAAARRRPATT